MGVWKGASFVTMAKEIQRLKLDAVVIAIDTWLGSSEHYLWEKFLPDLDFEFGYPRLYQGWGMFAPNPITEDGTVVVDGRTADGRRVDPFTGQEPDLDLVHSQGLGLGQIPQDYFNRIRLDRNVIFRQGLSQYLQAWHLRTGRPSDELVAFDVYWVRCQCPPVGEKKPYANELLAIMSWRKPGYRPPPGMPPLPPQPKIESAETPQPEKPKEPRTLFGHKLPEFLQ